MIDYNYRIPLPPPPRKRSRKRRLLLIAILLMIAVLFREGLLSLGRTIMDAPIADVPPVTELHPEVAAKSKQLTEESARKGIKILITDGFRSSAEQDALYRKGRDDEGSIVTKVKGGHSYHNYGLAVDFALIDKRGKAIWDLEYDGNGDGTSDWMEVVEIAKRLGFTWGGDWESFRDYPHLQMDFGYSIRELKRGARPPADTPPAPQSARRPCRADCSTASRFAGDPPAVVSLIPGVLVQERKR
ncbi:M15 family metallopeptidase [Paenibacillus oenotherae]|uniref:M15 family metallopeptidase n=2 Tax=Paenibacillus oenotherae TaxID=1435645 RepID=A0ABS7D6E8_9BACL|nr:M15 family metallopeptidase [Paenibacillus oenotherae]